MNNVSNRLNDLASTLRDLMLDAIKSVNGVSLNNSDSLYPFKNLLKLILAKAKYVCDATLAILEKENTLYPEAYAMTRVLLECYITIQYINKTSREELSERFYRYSDVSGYRFRQGWARSDSKLRERFDKHPKSDEQKKEVESYMHDYGDTKMNRRYWSGKPLEQMVFSIKEEFLYDKVYRYLCKYIHPESLILMHDLLMQDDDIIIKRRVTVDDIDRIITTCINLFSSIYVICSEVFDLKKEEEIEYINVEVTALKEEKKIRLIIEQNKCPFCVNSTVMRHDTDKVFFTETDHEKTYYVYGCTDGTCIERFYIPKDLFDKQQGTSK